MVIEAVREPARGCVRRRASSWSLAGRMSDYLQRLDVQGYLKAKAVLVAWDPIQLSDPGSRLPEEEWEHHAVSLMQLLDAKAGREEIVSFLRIVCRESLRRPFDQSRAEAAAGDLLEFWPRWKQQLTESRS